MGGIEEKYWEFKLEWAISTMRYIQTWIIGNLLQSSKKNRKYKWITYLELDYSVNDMMEGERRNAHLRCDHVERWDKQHWYTTLDPRVLVQLQPNDGTIPRRSWAKWCDSEQRLMMWGPVQERLVPNPRCERDWPLVGDHVSRTEASENLGTRLYVE